MERETPTLVWAAAHNMTTLQKAQLEDIGEVVLLEDINPNLHERMCNLEKSTDLKGLAKELQQYFSNNHILVQPAGNPAFHVVLGALLNERRVSAMVNNTRQKYQMAFAFSKRVSKDLPKDDGSIEKISLFVHEGWVEI